jgi:DNA repair protein RadC
VIRTGSANDKTMELAQRLLTEHGGLIGLARLNLYELCNERGVEEAKAAQIQATLALGRRLMREAMAARPTRSTVQFLSCCRPGC